MKSSIAGLAVCLAACAEEPPSTTSVDQEVLGTPTADLHRGVARIHSLDGAGNRTGVFVAPDLVATTWAALTPISWSPGEPVPRIVVEHGWVSTNSTRNQLIAAFVDDIRVHPAGELVLLHLVEPLVPAMDFPPVAAAPPAAGSTMRCVAYNRQSGNLRVGFFEVERTSPGAISFFSDIGDPHGGEDLAAVCSDELHHNIHGLFLGVSRFADTTALALVDHREWIAGQIFLSDLRRALPFSAARKLVSRSNGKCLDVPGAEPWDGLELNQFVCSSTVARNQQWYVDTRVAPARLVSASTGKCVTAGSGGLVQASCGTAASQRWTSRVILSRPNGLAFDNAGQCMTAIPGGYDGVQVRLTPCSQATFPLLPPNTQAWAWQ